MRKVIFILIVLGTMIPGAAFAHGDMMDTGNTSGSLEMMRYAEDRALGGELHEEMESLMAKMMSGDLTEEEAQRMIEIMDENPGAGSMMSVRMMGTMAGIPVMGYGYTHGSGYVSNAVFYWFLMSVWLLVGVLLAIWLIKSIVKR